MTLQEKYDRIIGLIEEFVEFGEPDIPEAVSREMGLNLRLLGDAFQFITDMTIIQFIRKRKLVHALSARMEQGLSVEQVVAQSGFSDAAAFSKACKKVFDLSPSQITEAVLSQHPPLTFDWITSVKAGELSENDILIAEKKQNTICGITAEQFAEVKHVLEIGALYGLTDEEAEEVYRLSQACKITTAQAAEFYEDFKLQIENGSFFGEYDLFEMAELACKYDLSFTEAQIIMGNWNTMDTGAFMSSRRDSLISISVMKMTGEDGQFLTSVKLQKRWTIMEFLFQNLMMPFSMRKSLGRTLSRRLKTSKNTTMTGMI